MRFGTFEQAVVVGFLLLIATAGAIRMVYRWWKTPENWGIWP